MHWLLLSCICSATVLICTATGNGRFKPVEGQTGFLEFTKPWVEDGLASLDRKVSIYLPSSYKSGDTTPLPVLFVFHGWGERAARYHANYDFKALADRDNFIVVYPEGVGDCERGAQCGRYTSWNAVGTTSSGNSRQGCNTSVHTSNYCYSSCSARKGSCHPCDWTTCYDDAAFIDDTLDDVVASYCVDTSKVFAWGCSNGGLMSHELAHKLPGRFAAIAAGCGGKPHEGWQNDLPFGSAPIPVMLISGRNDRTIPLETPPPNTRWWDGFKYASVGSVISAYKDYNGCQNTAPRAYQTPYTASSMSCTEEGYDCRGGVNVVNCLFDGGHDVNTATGTDSLQDEPQLAWSFFQSTFGGSPAPSPQPSPQPICVCDARHPYCWSQDSYCYKSATSSRWSRTTCPGTCTASYAGRSSR